MGRRFFRKIGAPRLVGVSQKRPATTANFVGRLPRRTPNANS
jgi:hypothetical protein